MVDLVFLVGHVQEGSMEITKFHALLWTGLFPASPRPVQRRQTPPCDPSAASPRPVQRRQTPPSDLFSALTAPVQRRQSTLVTTHPEETQSAIRVLGVMKIAKSNEAES